jgi:hypothetical protein
MPGEVAALMNKAIAGPPDVARKTFAVTRNLARLARARSGVGRAADILLVIAFHPSPAARRLATPRDRMTMVPPAGRPPPRSEDTYGVRQTNDERSPRECPETLDGQ